MKVLLGLCTVVKLYFPPHRETGSLGRMKASLVEHVLQSPRELLKLSVPSVVYAIQNNMAFIALSNLDAAVYQVTPFSSTELALLFSASRPVLG